MHAGQGHTLSVVDVGMKLRFTSTPTIAQYHQKETHHVPQYHFHVVMVDMLLSGMTRRAQNISSPCGTCARQLDPWYPSFRRQSTLCDERDGWKNSLLAVGYVARPNAYISCRRPKSNWAIALVQNREPQRLVTGSENGWVQVFSIDG